MDKKTKGSWLVYQTGKLENVTETSEFENSLIAGKCGILLSAISQDSQDVVNNQRLEALAKASRIKKIELPQILETLKNKGLVDIGKSGVEVLGITSAYCLEHTSDIFDSLDPTNIEIAAIDLCEDASTQPQLISEVSEKYGDIYEIPKEDVQMLMDLSVDIGFVDKEIIDGSKDMVFNGNLFRRDTLKKLNQVMDSLTHDDQKRILDFDEILKKQACATIDSAVKILGRQLFDKLSSVGIYDISVVSNETEEVAYITKPSAFSKYSNSMIEDAFDLAKMFLSSLTYGMTRSSYNRGQITMVEALLNNLISGHAVGPVPAIGEDYKVLELNNVIRVFQGSKNGRSGYMMRLLKKEVGILALEAIRSADVSSHSLTTLPSAAVNMFKGPELNRTNIRKKEVKMHPKSANDIILSLRTGGR